MRLQFIYMPVSDFEAALALYRDQLGFDEVWREGEATAALALPGSETALMVDGAPLPDAGPGPIFIVERVDDWLADQDGLDVTQPPFDIPGGRLMSFRDGSGNHVYVMDQSAA